MSDETLLETIQTLMRKVATNAELAVDETTVFETIEDWDSLNTVDLEMELENNLGIDFEIGEFQEFKTVGSLMESLQHKLK